MAEHIKYNGELGPEIFEHKDEFSVGIAVGIILFFAALSIILWSLVLTGQMFKGGKVGCALVGGPGIVILMTVVLIMKLRAPKRTTLFCKNGIVQIIDDRVISLPYSELKVQRIGSRDLEWGTRFSIRGTIADGTAFVFDKTFLRQSSVEQEWLKFLRTVIKPAER